MNDLPTFQVHLRGHLHVVNNSIDGEILHNNKSNEFYLPYQFVKKCIYDIFETVPIFNSLNKETHNLSKFQIHLF